MRLTTLSLALLAAVLLTACQGTGQSAITPTPAPQWTAFHSDEGGFTVQFPASPEKNIWSNDQSYGGIYTSTYQGMTFNAAFSIMAGGSKLPTEKLLETVRDSHAEELKAKILSSDPIELNGYPGLAYSLDAPKSKTLPDGGVVQARIYQINDRLYTIYHSGAKKNSLLPDVKKYLGSLKVDGMVELPTPVPIAPNAVVAPAGWQEFTSEQDGFSVLLPDKPKREVTRDKTKETASYFVQNGLDGYGVFLFNFKDPLPAEARPTVLFGILKESLLKQQPAVILDEKPIQLGPYSGYELLINVSKGKDQPVDGQVYARFYVADKRLYVVTTITAGTDAPPEVKPFLDSFKVLEPK